MDTTETPLYRCLCKATNRETGSPRYSLNWATSRRAYFKVFADRVECGSWIILFNQIERATRFRTKQWFIPISVLEIRTSTSTYQFGYNPWANPFAHLPVPMTEETVALKYSIFSLGARVLLLLGIFLLFRG